MERAETGETKPRQRLLYSVKEVAEQLSISKTTVRRLIESGQVKHRQIGNRMLIPRAELERLAKHGVARVGDGRPNFED